MPITLTVPHQSLKAFIRELPRLSKLLLKTVDAIDKKKKAEVTAKKHTKMLAHSIKAMGQAAYQIGSMVGGIMGTLFSFVEATGALQPIFDILTGVMQVIGGAILEELAPAITELAEVLFSPEMMEIWSYLGETIGSFLSQLFGMIVELLSDPQMQMIIKKFIDIFGVLFDVIIMILKPIIDWLGDMNVHELGAAIYFIGLAIATMMGLMSTGGPWGAAAYGLAWAALMSPLLFMQHGGIVTSPTLAMIGEAGPEAVIPLDRAGEFGGGNDDLLYATEDNTEILTDIKNELRYSNRFGRLKAWR